MKIEYVNFDFHGSRHIKKGCRLNAASRNLMESAIDRLGLSARAFNRILKISRTITDLEGKADVGQR